MKTRKQLAYFFEHSNAFIMIKVMRTEKVSNEEITTYLKYLEKLSSSSQSRCIFKIKIAA